MSKKEKEQQMTFVPDYNEVVVAAEEEQPLFETEAYGSPQPDAGSDVTVLKTVGTGSPVPIVAPKHNTVQLQPIIVPLAVVPYMTQDSGILRTDGKPAGGFAGDGEYAEAAAFESVGTVAPVKTKKKNSAIARICSLISLLLAAAIVVPYILANFYPILGDSLILYYINIIGDITAWTQGIEPASVFITVMFIISAFAGAISFIASLIGVIAGKYPRVFNITATTFSAVSVLVVMLYHIIKKEFIAQFYIMLIVLVAVTLLALLLSIVFTVVVNKREDREDRRQYDGVI